MGEHGKPRESGFPPMRAQDYSEMEDWPGYFGAVLGKEPRETLVRALVWIPGEDERNSGMNANGVPG